MEKVKAFFWWCSGANAQLLEESPSESSKYVGIGATVLFTGIFAFLSSAYALYTVFDNYFLSLLFGLFWGMMIFNLDRYIVSSMRKEGSAINEFKTALPRIVLALLLSIVIARPLELKIFEKEIDGELALMEQEFLSEQQNAVEQRFAGDISFLKNDIDRLKKEITDKEATRDKLMKIAQEEADGTGGSMKKNAGPIYQIKKADADKVDAELQELSAQNLAAITLKEQELSAVMKAMSDQRMKLKKEKLNGPAARLEALSRLSNKSTAIAFASFFILLLFMAIETAPVFVKLISPIGPYDHLLKLEEYKFEVKRAEEVGVMTAYSKERTGRLTNLEREFVEKKLNESMYKS